MPRFNRTMYDLRTLAQLTEEAKESVRCDDKTDALAYLGAICKKIDDVRWDLEQIEADDSASSEHSSAFSRSQLINTR